MNGVNGTDAERESDAIQDELNWLVADGVPGAFAYVDDQDGASRFYAAGAANLGSRLPLSPDTAYRVGSTTKTFTAVVILQLVAEDRLNLADRVAGWIDEWELPNSDQLTVEHLLRMRSGLFDFEDDETLAGNLEAHLRPYELDEVVKARARASTALSSRRAVQLFKYELLLGGDHRECDGPFSRVGTFRPRVCAGRNAAYDLPLCG